MFRRGQLAEVRSAAEIAATLDADGKLGGVPFMPEMIQYCGRRIRVFRHADRVCVVGNGMRRMQAAIFLQDARCDGAYHGGCQRGCLLFWKEAWLKPADGDNAPHTLVPITAPASAAAPASAPDDAESNRLRQFPTRDGERYQCQSTALLTATTPLSRWNISTLLNEIRLGELTLPDFMKIVARTILKRFLRVQPDRILAGIARRPSHGALDLTGGEWVRVKDWPALAEQVDAQGSNRGLAFRPTMNASVGGRFRVQFPIQCMILEQNGKMVQLRHTVVLKNVTCKGICAVNCPRDEHLFWRESWLERTDAPDNDK